MQLLFLNEYTLGKMMGCINWHDDRFLCTINESYKDDECTCEYYMNSLDKCRIIFEGSIFNIELELG